MAETITIFGKQYPKTWIMAGGAAVVGIAAYAYFKNGVSGGEEIAEEDLGILDTTGDERIPNVLDSSVKVDTRSGYKSDQEWYQAAIDLLLNNFGVATTSTAAKALDNYLANRDMTQAQIDMLHFVINTLGYPPSGQKSLRLATSTTPTPSQTSRSKPTAITGLKLTSTRSQITASWNKSTGAGTYRIDLIQNISDVIESDRTTATSWKSSVKLQPNKPYRVKVWGLSNQNVAGPSATTTIHTKR